jgi:hypothetical protein
MDEPCSALDPIATQRVEELIVRAQGQVHHRHRHAQHAAGGPGVVTSPGFSTRGIWWSSVRPTDLHRARPRADRSLYHGEIRMSPETRTGTFTRSSTGSRSGSSR